MLLSSRSSRSLGTSLLAIALLAAVASTGCATRVGHRLGHGCGCACPVEAGCAVDPGCACEPDCACEPGCACEPSCGCGPGRGYAGQYWKGCGCCEGPKICVCKPCGNCGCEPTCCAEPDCCAEPTCGCDDGCGCGSCCGSHGHRPLWALKYAVGSILKPLTACGGCDGELYWSEWHNDPPCCCDPCDRCGNYIGPSTVATPLCGERYSVGHRVHEAHAGQQHAETMRR